MSRVNFNISEETPVFALGEMQTYNLKTLNASCQSQTLDVDNPCSSHSSTSTLLSLCCPALALKWFLFFWPTSSPARPQEAHCLIFARRLSHLCYSKTHLR